MLIHAMVVLKEDSIPVLPLAAFAQVIGHVIAQMVLTFARQ